MTGIGMDVRALAKLAWQKNPEGDCTVTVQFWSDF
jgi:hypothetical protein